MPANRRTRTTDPSTLELVHIRRGEQKLVPVNIAMLLLALFIAIGRSAPLLDLA